MLRDADMLSSRDVLNVFDVLGGMEVSSDADD